ncbi:MAG: hypothetical protein IIA87_05885 [Nanoarchaeota archaeon]|nr:hypothetical protein [Nanoarchaeota archaeon]
MKKQLKNIVASAALAAGSLAGEAIAQEERNLEDRIGIVERREQVSDTRTALKGKVKSVGFYDESGIWSQSSFNGKYGDLSLRTIVSTSPDQNDYGFNISSNRYEANFGFGEGVDGSVDVGRASFSFLGEGDSFLETTLQYDQSEGDGLIFSAGSDLEGVLAKFRAEGTFDMERNARGVVFYDLGEGIVGLGGGISEDGTSDFNLNWGGENTFGEGLDTFAYVKFGDRDFDGRLAIGNISKDLGIFAGSVRGLGNNELDDYGDQTYKFDIGDDPDISVNYFGAATWFLDEEPGSWAFDIRYEEKERAYVDFGYRLGDIGPFRNSAILVGVNRDLIDDFTGARVQYLFDIGEHAEAGITGSVNEDGDVKGSLYGGFKFEF